jgi:S-formylglutathione hydrolase FrmB
MTVVNDKAGAFPIARLGELAAGEYFVQAVLDTNQDLRSPGSPGNLCSEPQRVTLNPSQGQTVPVVLCRRVPDEQPAETEHIKFVKFRSEGLSRFHGRPMFLRVGILLPRDFAREPTRRYPLRVRIGGYGTRYSEVAGLMSDSSDFRKLWLADDTPRMVLLHLDGAGPYGDPYQTNSANNGPYGDAVVHELIPHIERTFRCIGTGQSRFLDGASTGGWVSLALQIYYPDSFNGAWAQSPDPVDFRAYELIDIYGDDNAYVNARGFERPAARERNGDVRTTVRHECQMENALGHGDLWTRSGKDWGAWNAVFGPRGADGQPVSLWHPRTGKIDRSVLEHWRKYDLRQVLEKNWPVLGPRLRGKLHIWVGEADEYFLNNAVHLLDEFLTRARPAYEGTIAYGPGQGHDWRGITEKEKIGAMAQRATGPRP